jgi:DNA mismatch endonuclease (patch repair protein)
MQANKGRDTRPELALRRAVHALGMRYFVNRRPLKSVRRTADLLFPRLRIAVFLDGCFWHGCPDHHVPPRSNAGYWAEKTSTNRRRDADTDELLRDNGWLALRVWEHEDPESAALRILERVSQRSADIRRTVLPGGRHDEGSPS